MKLIVCSAFAAAALAFAAVPEAQSPAPGPVTFTRDVAPIFQRACQNCHRPGSIAPMSLLTYEDARPWAKSIRARVSHHEMPPWFIDRSVGIQQFKEDPSLRDDEIETIVNWVDAGAPKGDMKDMPPPVQLADLDTWRIG